ncbi:hypothetical protein ACQ4PT_017969 [Festuca glaucescens]
MSPPRRRLWPFRSSRSAAILDAVRRTRHQRRHRLRKLQAAVEDSTGSKASSAQTNGHQGGISQGDDNTRQQDLFEKLLDNANTPMLQSKLPHLKNLEIGLSSLGCFGSSYDVLSLVSFLDASPALESFILRLKDDAMARCPVVGDDDECPRRKLKDDAMARCPVVGDDDECPRRKVDLWHNRLRQVTITGFCSAKSLVELTVHILESTLARVLDAGHNLWRLR